MSPGKSNCTALNNVYFDTLSVHNLKNTVNNSSWFKESKKHYEEEEIQKNVIEEEEKVVHLSVSFRLLWIKETGGIGTLWYIKF